MRGQIAVVMVAVAMVAVGLAGLASGTTSLSTATAGAVCPTTASFCPTVTIAMDGSQATIFINGSFNEAYGQFTSFRSLSLVYGTPAQCLVNGGTCLTIPMGPVSMNGAVLGQFSARATWDFNATCAKYSMPCTGLFASWVVGVLTSPTYPNLLGLQTAVQGPTFEVPDHGIQGGCGSGCASITAGFTWSQQAGTLNVTFRDSTRTVNGVTESGVPRWSFGDGSSGNGSAPSHSYSRAGTFNVTETVVGELAGQNYLQSTVSYNVMVNATSTTTGNRTSPPPCQGTPGNCNVAPPSGQTVTSLFAALVGAPVILLLGAALLGPLRSNPALQIAVLAVASVGLWVLFFALSTVGVAV